MASGDKSARLETEKTTAPDGARSLFTKGGRGGPGRPKGVGRASLLRDAILHEFNQEDYRKLARRIYDEGMQGNVQAAKEIFDRTLGKAEAIDLLDRIAELEAIVERLTGGAAQE